MTREQLLDAVGDIRDAFIREAAPPPAAPARSSQGIEGMEGMD